MPLLGSWDASLLSQRKFQRRFNAIQGCIIISYLPPFPILSSLGFGRLEEGLSKQFEASSRHANQDGITPEGVATGLSLPPSIFSSQLPPPFCEAYWAKGESLPSRFAKYWGCADSV
ncbi:hypothetical protein TEQG_03327 [Trichophyton equinum CBS 127.97]|uniref:Uncharacterized protein n=1 Tax=Trichophyton equinum (strain ATCC MYA-4606 / CBS 127.97) TaxID=559882 RepID=F2PQX9_TRIEC|nr:hypothetical protein TEQG_03327 [Trichophyton equinum CBS 127.97]